MAESWNRQTKEILKDIEAKKHLINYGKKCMQLADDQEDYDYYYARNKEQDINQDIRDQT
jgi:hypothetical protein